MRIAYFVNQYPAVSHAFIRREILALEARGFEILRIALRGWEGELVDEIDELERSRCRYVLRNGILPLILTVFKTFLSRPLPFSRALVLALRMGARSGRLPYHLGYLAEACQMLPWLQEFDATHIHAHFGTNSAEIVMLACELGGPPYSFTVHGPDEFDMPQQLGIDEKVRRSAFTVAITSYARSQLYRWTSHEHWHRVKVVHCGLEEAYYQIPPVEIPEQNRLVCIGRLSEQKGQMLLIEAARALRERGFAFELVLVGGGPLREQLAELIERYELSNHVRLAGIVPTEDLQQELLDSRALVLPSFAEGLPMVIMEAMALRRPVLSTYVAGIPELVVDGENGWLIPPGSIDDLESAMEAVIRAPTKELQALGEAGYRRVRSRHSVDFLAMRLAELINGSLESSVTRPIGRTEARQEGLS